MFIQIAFVLICFAVLTHITMIWFPRRLRVRKDAEMARMRNLVDWRAPKQPRKQRSALSKFFLNV